MPFFSAEAKRERQKSYRRKTFRDFFDRLNKLSTLRRQAMQGHAKAMCELGLFYNLGLGVVQSKTLSRRWWQKAADGGSVKALEFLAREAFEQGQKEQALSYVQQAAKANSAWAKVTWAYFGGPKLELTPHDLETWPLGLLLQAAKAPQGVVLFPGEKET